jgi:flagellar motor switch protein FliM
MSYRVKATGSVSSTPRDGSGRSTHQPFKKSPMRQLSQDEIDAVFQSRQGAVTSRPEERAVPFDFEKPDRIPKSQLRVIRFLHENFVRTLSSSFSAYLRAYSSGHLVSVEQIPYATFLDGLPLNTCMVSLSLLPYGDNAVLEISPSLIFPVLELLLGGKDAAIASMSRELTEMERHLLSNFFRLITTDLEQAWKEVDAVEFRVESLETKLRPARSLGPTEAVVAIGMEFRIDEGAGMINLAIPSITIKSMVQKFDQQESFRDAAPGDADQRQILKLLNRASIILEPRMISRLSVRDLLALKVGSVVLLDHPTARSVACAANGKTKFEGEIICADEQMDFVIDRVIGVN